MKSTVTNHSSKPSKFLRYLLLILLSVIMSFSLRGCELLNLFFAVINYGTNTGYNAVVHGFSYYYYAANEGKIYRHTGDDDDPWELNYTASGSPNLLDIAALRPYASYLCVGDNGTILRLEDEHEQWQLKTSNVSISLNKILGNYFSKITGHDILFVFGGSGTVLKSTDIGETWNTLDFPTTDNLYDITSNSANNLIIVSGENYSLYASKDDGENWFPIGPSDFPKDGPFSSYNKIYFYNDNIGYVGGPNGLILKTTDGGFSWVTTVATGFDEVNDLFFISPDSGAAVGLDGVARLTTDGGDNWFEDTELTAYLNGETIKRIVPFGMNHGLVIGENGFDIFVAKDSTYLDSMPIVTNVDYEDLLVEQFHLLQNYPNPFNPITTINYQIPETEFVTLKVYDVLGNEIATIVNEEKPAGTYEVNFNAEGLTSGIYFYRIQAGSFIETKKMILLK